MITLDPIENWTNAECGKDRYETDPFIYQFNDWCGLVGVALLRRSVVPVVSRRV